MARFISCLSVRQPWASLLVTGIKNIENRTWYSSHRGRILIHASKTWGPDEELAHARLMDFAIAMRDDRRQYILSCVKDNLGGIIGECEMQSCITSEDWFVHGGLPYDGKHEWFTGPYGYLMTNAVMYRRIIPYRGQQKLFLVSADAIRKTLVDWSAKGANVNGNQ